MAFAPPINKGCIHHSISTSYLNNSTCSSFQNRFIIPSQSTHNNTQNKSAQIYMKKGRSRQNLQPRRPELSLPEDGTPIFALFVRTTRAKMWYPLGAVQGDDRSKNLVNALKGGFAKGFYQNALDKGVAQTVYGKDCERFRQNTFRMYPQLKKYQSDLEFGYRLAANGLDDQPTKVVTEEMALPFPAWAKRKIDNILKKD